MKTFTELGVQVPDILLPKDMDTSTWGAVACDQYTQDKDYWARAAAIAQDKPSTLNLMLPEAFLDDDKAARIERIHRTMREYMAGGVFAPPRHGFIYVERQTKPSTASPAHTRHGLIAAIDLEQYDWHPDTRMPIRATEATIPERIPPRVAIRRGSPLDMPHIMLLANDAEGILVEAVGHLIHAAGTAPLYDGELMLGGGHITGYAVDKAGEEVILAALNQLSEHGTAHGGAAFLFAVGDGNHSLATAKSVWEEYKATLPADERAASPVRYALVEIVNLYDDGLLFEPIHRLIIGVANKIDLIAELKARLGGELVEVHDTNEMLCTMQQRRAFGIVSCGRYVTLDCSPQGLPVAHLQTILDDYLKSHCDVQIDYIHGSNETIELGNRPNNLGILLPPINKDGLFQTVAERGSLPRKSFSMGEANEKRYYMECKRLFD